MKTTKFKPSEVGPIPEEWEVKRLGNCAEIARGGSPRPIEAYLTTASNGLNWVKIGDVGVGAKYIERTEEKIKPEGLSSTRQVSAGDFVLSNSMSFGRPYIMKIDGCIHDGWLVIQDYRKQFETEYLFYSLGSEWVFRQYKTLAAGSSVLNLNKDVVARVVVPVPPRPEQEKIAEALSDVDALLAAMTKLIEKKRAIKQGAMQELLTGKKRLAGFTGKWVEKRLGDVGEFVGGGTPSTAISSYWGGDIDWYTPAEIGYAKYVNSSNRRITNEGLRNSAARVLPAGAILLTTRASIGIRAILKHEAATNQGFQSLIVNEESDSEFMYYFLSTVVEEMESRASGSTFLEISSSKLKEIPIVVPQTVAEQKAIASVLSDMDAEIAALEATRAKYESIKQGMMQELLTGKTRLV